MENVNYSIFSSPYFFFFFFFGAVTKNMKNSMQALQKQNYQVIQQFPFWMCIQRKWDQYPEEISTPHVHCNFNYNSQDTEAT